MSVKNRIRAIDRDDPGIGPLQEAATILRAGGLVAFATETVYGLGAVASNASAISRIYTVKGRPTLNPLIVHADSVEMARQCAAEWTDLAESLAQAFWPGPLTLVLPRASGICELVTAGRDTVGVRVPEPAVARGLISETGSPLAAPSANRSCGLSPTLAIHVAADLGDDVDLILDSGPTTEGIESTIVDLTTREPRILRPGPISGQQLMHVLGGIRVREAPGEIAAGDEGPSLSPGRLAVHYAPRTPAIRLEHVEQLLDENWDQPTALLVVGPHELPPLPDNLHRYELEDPQVAARRLYATLHECDDLQVSRILVVMPPDHLEWQAIRDRLTRATRPPG